MKTVELLDGARVPALGQGTWRMGEDKTKHKNEVAALLLGIELGMTLIDTAEMYGEGGAEEVVADAIAGQRDRVFVVSKVYPHNASRTKLPKACDRSLRRLRTETIDLYLLHWRGEVPLAETVEAFEKLRSNGKIRRWGVSNFDIEDMEELWRLGSIAATCSANQVLYNLQHRQIEFDLLPFCSQLSKTASPARTNYPLPIMAYSPVGHGRGLLNNGTLKEIAKCHGAAPAQIALAWVLRQPQVIAIPKSSNQAHVRENVRAAELTLTDEDLAELDNEFPPPKSKQPLPTL
jgi:diketogulonate reductase-like aldo/keto reductase